MEVKVPPVCAIVDLAQHRAERVAPDGTFVPRIVSARSGTFCRHRQVEVDSQARVVSCRNCQATLDPIDVISMFAHEEGNFCFLQKDLKASLKELEQQVNALQRQRDNLRAAVKRAGKRGANE